MRGKVLAVRPTFEICDPQGKLVAVVKKRRLKMWRSEWWLEDSAGKKIARIKGGISAHKFTIQSPSGDQVAQIHKKWISIRDGIRFVPVTYYRIEIWSSDIDAYVIEAYAIAMDHVQFQGYDKGFAGFEGAPRTPNGFSGIKSIKSDGSFCFTSDTVDRN